MRKTNNLFIITLLLLALGSASCKKDLSDRFNNPDQLSSGVTDIVPGLFTSTISNNKLFIQDYGEWYYLFNRYTIVTYAQIAERYISYRYTTYSTYGDLTSGNGFSDYPITGQSFWEASYERIKSWETVRAEVGARSGQAKLDADMYLKLLNIVRVYQSAKLVDLFNSIPYFNAFQGASGSSTYWYPVYDDPKAIYEDIITQLGNTADSLPIAYSAMSATGQQIFAAQDIAFKGDVTKWVKFANATRLKLLVRLAGVDPSFAKPLIQATLAKTLPKEDIQFSMWYNTDLQSSGGFWMRGMYENTSDTFIPEIMMRRMNYGDSMYNPGLDDPRLPVIAMPTKYNSYRGTSYNIDVQSPMYDAGEIYYNGADNLATSLTRNSRSLYNHATIVRNSAMPVYMFSLAELDLLLAEIELKGLATTGEKAEDHMKDAVIHSTNYWYALNAASDYKSKITAVGGVAALYPAKPSDIVISRWGDTISKKFVAAATVDDKMEILMQQKYIHLNLMQPYELWTELRRTGHPKLEPLTWHGTVFTPFAERVHYPSSEQQNNPTNYAKVSAANNNTTAIFWVPTDRNKTLYWSDYNYK